MEEKIVALEKENKILRKLLCLNHGHSPLYLDDGCYQCSQCRLDFLVVDIDHIVQTFKNLSTPSNEQLKTAAEEINILLKNNA